MIKFFKLVTISSFLFLSAANAQSKKQKQQEVYDKIVKANLQHPKIVLKQAVHESANFKSSGAKNKNNILGLMKTVNPGTNRERTFLRSFNSIEECINFYKNNVQNRYKGGDYYKFLNKIGYATDKKYKQKVQNIPLFIIE